MAAPTTNEYRDVNEFSVVASMTERLLENYTRLDTATVNVGHPWAVSFSQSKIVSQVSDSGEEKSDNSCSGVFSKIKAAVVPESMNRQYRKTSPMQRMQDALSTLGKRHSDALRELEDIAVLSRLKLYEIIYSVYLDCCNIGIASGLNRSQKKDFTLHVINVLKQVAGVSFEKQIAGSEENSSQESRILESSKIINNLIAVIESGGLSKGESTLFPAVYLSEQFDFIVAITLAETGKGDQNVDLDLRVLKLFEQAYALIVDKRKYSKAQIALFTSRVVASLQSFVLHSREHQHCYNNPRADTSSGGCDEFIAKIARTGLTSARSSQFCLSLICREFEQRVNAEIRQRHWQKEVESFQLERTLIRLYNNELIPAYMFYRFSGRSYKVFSQSCGKSLKALTRVGLTTSSQHHEPARVEFKQYLEEFHRAISRGIKHGWSTSLFQVFVVNGQEAKPPWSGN